MNITKMNALAETIQTVSGATVLGRMARTNGLPITSCPWADSEFSRAWYAGWNDIAETFRLANQKPADDSH